MTSPFAGIFASLLSAAFVVVCASSPTGESLKWSSYYFAEGNILIPLAEVKEPFKIWFDLESNCSRIDYYDGMTKVYQFSNNTDKHSGYDYKIVPVPKTITENIKKCVAIFHKDNWHLQSIVPDLINFTFHSKQVENDKIIEKWIYNTNENNVKSTYEVLLYKKDNVIYPVRFETKGYNMLFNSHVDHYIIEYKNFSVYKPDQTIFFVEDQNCAWRTEYNINHVYYFNPMKEFVQNYDEHVDSTFEHFKRHHNKNYTDGTKEHFKSKNNFRQNMRFIHSKNRANVGYELEMNHFTDYSNEELTTMLNYRMTKQTDDVTEYNASFSRNDIKSPPSVFDWRVVGAVTPVKDQALCGSCWSFGAVGVLEGAYFMKYGKRESFSEQALMDCSWEEKNRGCDGGTSEGAYRWIEKHGIPTAEQYGPYLSQEGNCHMANIPSENLTKISGYKMIWFMDEESLQDILLNHGPISVVIDATPRSFKFYSSGVYYDQECAPENMLDLPIFNHAMLLVGYGTLHGEPYWLLKNSWSTMWGNDGYIFMSRKDNMCGILTRPSYVIL